KHAYCLKTQPATGETYPKSDLFNKATLNINMWYGVISVMSGEMRRDRIQGSAALNATIALRRLSLMMWNMSQMRQCFNNKRTYTYEL
ncbi:hypothetical protein, partial [Klebsiella pneumoniae]|uniref:hypothetical protein n=1 Tax=Klebsiella pneumoniae TaxID=573 RepID=UPI001B8C895E